MQTHFTPAQLNDPDIRLADSILRACVHCGFCTATCPTFVLTGDERDSPRGRIWLMREYLELGDTESAAAARPHLDRCLTCLACMTTCPSGVHYRYLVDMARERIEAVLPRPRPERLMRGFLSRLLPNPTLFRLALIGGLLAKPFAALLPARLRAMVRLAPAALPGPSRVDKPQVFRAEGPRRKRVALLSGCAQQVLAPRINEATVRLLTRHGCEVVVAKGMGCCGALRQHMGEAEGALAQMRANVAAWSAEIAGDGLDAIVVNASGCGTTVKDYGHLLRHDADWRIRAERVSALACDVTELMQELDFKPVVPVPKLKVAYHAACSLQHGQKVTAAPKALLTAAGFEVRDVPEGHLCCGSAGTYNLLQPELAGRLKARKIANIESLAPDVVAAGNIGCLVQIASGFGKPVVHTVELLDWASGGPDPISQAWPA